ncbi:MAG: ABC transporter permease, partial [Myxococcales bacterium]|nr:ABC transporter permease [Myxococcales bacterium]
GLNTSIFSAVYASLLRPLPFSEPDELMIVLESQPDIERLAVPYPNYLDYKAENTSFETLGAMSVAGMTVTGLGNPEHLLVELHSHDLLPAFGVEPALGRAFLPEEDAPSGARAVLLQHSFWTRRFASDPDVVGQKLTIDSNEWTIVGVMPEGFKTLFPCELLIPLGTRAAEPLFRDRAARPEVYLIGRLKDGVSEAQARADLLAISDGLAQRFPEEHGASRPLLRPLQEELAEPLRGGLLLLLAAVTCVLLIAASNVANLMLERAMTRQKEMLVRAALGSGRWRLIRQLLVESVLLAMIGGAAGLLLALWGVDLLVAMGPRTLGGLSGPLTINGPVLLYTLVVALGTGLLFGLWPALYASRQDLSQALKESDHHASAGASRLRARGLLVVGEVALAVALLIVAVLSIRGLNQAHQVELGFEPQRLLMAGLSATPVPDAPPATAMQFWDEALRNVLAIPGVEAAGWSATAPLVTDQLEQFLPPGVEASPENMRSAITYLVSPGFIETLDVPLLAGRTFGSQDVAGTTPGLIVDQEFADAFFPDQNPIGQRVRDKLSGLPSVEIIGVVGHVRQAGADAPEKIPYQMYYAFAQLPETSQQQVRLIFIHMVVRFTGSIEDIIEPLRSAVAAADPTQPVFALGPYSDHVDRSLMARRSIGGLLGLFAALALVLAVIGLSAVMGNVVVQRTHELGVRIALGAQPRAVVGLVIRQGMTLVGAGIAIGMLGAYALSRTIATLMPGSVDETDLTSYLAVALGLGVIGLAATYLPARRATRVDPMVALRQG